MKTFALSLTIALCTWASLCAQDPVYFTIGEEELAGVSVYSICESHDQILYVSTDQGIFRYDHGRFTKMPMPKEQLGSSLFGLTTNTEGILHCYNLSGQVFRFEKGKWELYYQADRQDIGSNVNVEFDDQGRLLLASKYVWTWHPKTGKRLLFERKFASTPDLTKLPNGQVIIGGQLRDSLRYIEDEQIKAKPSEGLVGDTVTGWKPLLMGNDIHYAFHGILYDINSEDTTSLSYLRRARFFQFDDQSTFILGASEGAYELIKNGSRWQEKRHFFKDLHISTVHRGLHDIMYYGTFGKGIRVVVNHDSQQYRFGDNAMDPVGLCVDANGLLYFATRDARLFKYSFTKPPIQIAEQNAYTLDRLFAIDHFDFGLHQDYPFLIHNAPKMPGAMSAIKDVWPMDNGHVLFATSNGVFLYARSGEVGSLWASVGALPYEYRLKDTRSRVRAVAYSESADVMYYATAQATYSVDRTGAHGDLSMGVEKFNATDLLVTNEQLYVATIGQGVLVFDQDKLVDQLTAADGLWSDDVRQIEIQANLLFIRLNSAMQVYDLSAKAFLNIGRMEGGTLEPPIDFVVDQSFLHVLEKEGITSINLGTLEESKPTLSLSLDSIRVGGVRLAQWSGSRDFSYDENELEFFIHFKSIVLQEEASILYQLEGYDNDWQSMSAIAKSIPFKALAPGEYTLRMKVVYRGHESEEQIITFEILPPYWQTWWFYTIVGLALVLIIISFFLFRIRQIRRKNAQKLRQQVVEKELIQSQLKALRSQMNPHFIFNSLNSIQDLILQEETDKSYDYIALFADLVRSTLKYSNHEFISLEQELEFINVYLNLEKLRFKDQFEYQVTSEGNTNVQVPSLLVQPFIENALLHGLLHKSGPKKLTIEFACTDHLTCTITDNGIGREGSAQIATRRGTKHESFSLEAIRQRMAILSEQYGDHVGYEIIDLQEGGQALGTKVIIKMPHLPLF